jgi:hypothetical protein
MLKIILLIGGLYLVIGYILMVCTGMGTPAKFIECIFGEGCVISTTKECIIEMCGEKAIPVLGITAYIAMLCIAPIIVILMFINQMKIDESE